MNFLSNLAYQDNVQEDKDVVGGGYTSLDSGIYPATIKYAYLSQAKSGAGAVNFEFDVNGSTHKETLYVTTREGKNYYEKDGVKSYLPSFTNVDAISLFATGKPLSEQTTDNKVINLYNFDQKKEVPTQVPMLTELLGKTIKLGIIKEKSFKQVKNDLGVYVDSDETRETSVINKVFSNKDNRTVNEVKAEQAEAEFYGRWLEKWEGQVKDKTLGKAPTKPTSTPSQAPKKSGLFG